MRVFRQGTEKVEDVRNAAQRLNHEIDKLVAANRLRPLFGPERRHASGRPLRGTEDQPKMQCEGHLAAGADLFTFATAEFGGKRLPGR